MSSGTADALGLSRAILCNGESSSRQPDGQLSIKLTSLPQRGQPRHTFVSLGPLLLSKSYYNCQLWAFRSLPGGGEGTDLGGQVLPAWMPSQAKSHSTVSMLPAQPHLSCSCAVLLSPALDQEVALPPLSPLPLPVLREAMCGHFTHRQTHALDVSPGGR